MVLEKLKYQFRLSVTELDAFLSEFLTQYQLPVDEPLTEEYSLAEIYLPGKEVYFESALADYRKSIKRSKKMPQTAQLTELDEKRIKLLSGIIAYIRSCCKDVDETVVAAAKLYLNFLDEYKNYHNESNSSQSALIRKFVEGIQGEPYTEAFATLKLQARTEELQLVNNDYVYLNEQRNITEKNLPDAPSKVRKRCMDEYRNLVDLVNMAVRNNREYMYGEKLTALAALTEKTQELINRRSGTVAVEDETASEGASTDSPSDKDVA